MEYSRSTGESPSVAVASALARFYDEAAADRIPRLYDYVDPDGLDALFADRPDGTPRGSGEVRFTVEDATVVVRPETVRVFENASPR
ncbi:HalOD1 output domain-containing protein [Halovivax sp.]|uniref:HalOD1 output domain-containing protein n=1 Tax=Halovivax sp. TaxID=1935978 RepID=UPI0031B87E2A